MYEEIKAELLSLPEIVSWPDMVVLVEGLRPSGDAMSLEIPLLAAQAMGGEPAQAVGGAAVIFCMLASIHLVDDMLDEEPGARYHSLGEARVANFALAFQAAAFCLVERFPLTPAARGAVHGSLGRMAIATARGQDLEHTGGAVGEAAYWRAVLNKTPPLFSAALFIGAVLGGATVEIAERLAQLGVPIGALVQIHDDLSDAMADPAKPDWQSRWNNLALLYAMTAEHCEKSRFLQLVGRVDEPEALSEAQDILVRSGAVSFCFYHLIELYREACSLLRAMPLPNPTPIEQLLNRYIDPLRELCIRKGIELPELFGSS